MKDIAARIPLELEEEIEGFMYEEFLCYIHIFRLGYLFLTF